MSDALGKKISYVDLSPADYKAALEQKGTPEYYVENLLGLEGIKAAGYSSACTDDVKRILKRKPRTFADVDFDAYL